MPTTRPDANSAHGESLHAEYLEGVRDFSKRDISRMQLTDVEFLRCDFSDTKFVNCEFTNVTFNDGRFQGARFDHCRVTGCRFHRALMDDVVLNPSIFNRSDFLQASLRRADFLNCDAVGAYFGQADLTDASLFGGKFAGAWFIFTNLTGTTLVGGDFKNALVKGFNSIDTATIAKNAELLHRLLSQRDQLLAALPADRAAATEEQPGNDTPSEFLNRLDREFEDLRDFLLASGCNPLEVAQMTDAAERIRIEYPRVFISYSNEDEDLATTLYSALTTAGVETWIALENMRTGRKIHEQLEEATAEWDKVILILSESSLASQWLMGNLQWTVTREISSGNQILFPIRIVPFETVRQWTLFDADLGQDVAKYTRQYFMPDFSGWKDAHQLAKLTERFLRDLRQRQYVRSNPV